MKREEFIRWIEKHDCVVPLDGGMGTLLADKGWSPPSLPEEMNMSAPEIVESIHSSYVKAGAAIIETNTFGGTPVKMAHRGLSDRAREINERAARLAKKAAQSVALVAGSVGPLGELLTPFGPLSFDEAYEAFRAQMGGLVAGGVDLLLIETMIDLREAKAAVMAARDVAPGTAFVVSFTFDQKGRTVTGTPPEVAARWARLMGAAGVGANCGVGPEAYVPVAKVLNEHAGIPVFVYANAGLPSDGEYCPPDSFADWGRKLAEAGATVVGGCCGSTPEYISKLAAALKGVRQRRSEPVLGTPLASRSKLVLAGGGHPFRVIGERINVSRKSPLRDEVERMVWTTLREEARLQDQAGADIIDVNVGLPSIDQETAMAAAVTAAGQSTQAPLSIDSDSPSVIEAGLAAVTGIPLLNSFTAKEDVLLPGLALAARHGASVIVLPIDEEGLPESIEARRSVIRKVLRAADSAGFPREGLMIDGLTLAAGADHDAPKVTLDALSYLSDEGIASVLGVSNISHGMPARSLLNRTFTAMAMAAGLDAAIINPLDRSMMEAISASELLAGRDPEGRRFIAASPSFQSRAAERQAKEAPAAAKAEETLPVEESMLPLSLSILRGDEQQAHELAKELLDSGETPLELVNRAVIPALEEVGGRYDRGEFFLPQLISSAASAQRACDLAMEIIEKAGGTAEKGRVLLATVEGDLHDLGKNVVGTVLKSHGYRVADLGKDVPAARIIEEAERGGFDIVGLSALMTSTMKGMAETAQELSRRLPGVFVIVGGASVSEGYARSIGAHGYAPDAVSAVRLVESLLAGRDDKKRGE
ncbi:MAG: dihydropteroate synthase [Synergistaceae bacterium]|nr:homocysteine S-methyltransferase family protein [Synergistota bacterium]NLM71766.1 dihydropteroate synthase [Synergistaceae bacterium]